METETDRKTSENVVNGLYKTVISVVGFILSIPITVIMVVILSPLYLANNVIKSKKIENIIEDTSDFFMDVIAGVWDIGSIEEDKEEHRGKEDNKDNKDNKDGKVGCKENIKQ